MCGHYPLDRQPNESGVQSAALATCQCCLEEEGCGVGSLTEERIGVHRREVLGGTHHVKMKELFFTVRDLCEEAVKNCQPASCRW